jgi:catalase
MTSPRGWPTASGPTSPTRSPPTREPLTDLEPSPASSILANAPGTFAGRKLGILLTDGVDAGLLGELRTAAEEARATVELIAPTVGCVTLSDGARVPAE